MSGTSAALSPQEGVENGDTYLVPNVKEIDAACSSCVFFKYGGSADQVTEYAEDNSSVMKASCSLPLTLDTSKTLTDVKATNTKHVCAICHEKIKAEETAEIKGCEHSYCVTCILRWASYKTEPWCPQCRLPFSFLYVYRALDGTISDYMFEESVCLLLRAFWFEPLVVQETDEQDDYQDDYDTYEEPYYTSNLRLGNRRWGDSGYVRAGRREARPVAPHHATGSSGSLASSSRQAKREEQVKEAVGRRARRAQKREQLDKLSGKR